MVELDKNAPESTGEPVLRRAIELISSLISISHSSKVFTAKWQSIRNKLDELNSGLFAAENCNSGASPSLTGVIFDVIDTCESCHDLANRCVNFRYSGKLLMQSDIDVIAAKFDRHVMDLSKIVTSGILTVSNAIVVVKPGLGACRDDVKFYLNDLLTRLKIGDLEMKIRSSIALNEFILEDDNKYVKICIEIDGFVSVVVSFLDSHVVDLQEEATKFVSVISKFDMYKHVLVGYGIVSKLIRVLECGSESGKEISTGCLLKLTVNSDNAWSVSAHGGVTALLKICTRDENCSGELIGLACAVLKNLVGVEEIKRFMVDEGAISTFVNLAGSKNELSQTNSIELLQTMVFEDEAIRQMAINEGGIRVLVRVFDPKTTLSLKTREVAFKAIDHLCFSSTSSTISVLMSYGFLDHLLYFLRHGEVGVQELALKAAFRLCGLSDELKKTMGDSGFMPEFVKFLDAKSYQVREMAAEALYVMTSMSRNQRKFIQEDPSIVVLLQLLGPEDHVNNSGATRKFVLSTLLLLTNCSSGRRKIVNSGYMKNMEKLAEADVSDAKRIIRKLSTNTFRSMLKGIWHS